MCSEKNCLAENVLEAYENNGTAHSNMTSGVNVFNRCIQGKLSLLRTGTPQSCVQGWDWAVGQGAVKPLATLFYTG